MMMRHGLICAFSALLLTSCSAGGDEGDSPDRDTERPGSKVVGASKEAEVEGTERQPDNPAEREGVKVYRPERLADISYDQNKRAVVDLETGDRLVNNRVGHAGGPGLFGFSNERTGEIAGGEYVVWDSNGVTVFEVTKLVIWVGKKHQYLAREEYEISRLAEMFRALREAQYRKAQPHSKTGFRKEVLVVDSRPKKISEIDPVNGQPKVEK